MTALRRDGQNTGFQAWIRNNPNLDSSRAGLVFTDSDLWCHKYFAHVDRNGTRDVQCLMLIEVKEFGADISETQQDTLHIINQVLRNRRQINEYWSECSIRKAHSLRNKRAVDIWSFGVHVLRVPGDGTFMQWHRMTWDKHQIGHEQLERILRFELDPDTLEEISFRRHHLNGQICKEADYPLLDK